MTYTEIKKKVEEVLIRLQGQEISFKMIAQKMKEIDKTLPVYPALLTRLKDKDFKFHIQKIEDYLRCLEAVERSFDTSDLPNLYFVGYFSDNEYQIRKTILEIWEQTGRIRLSFVGQRTVFREGFFQINGADKSIAFTTKDEYGENFSFILTKDNGQKLSVREKMLCVYAARFPGYNPVVGKMYFYKQESRIACENAEASPQTIYKLYHKRLQSTSENEHSDDSIDKIRSYVGVYKGYYFPDKNDNSTIKVGVCLIGLDGSIRFKVANRPKEYTGIVKISTFADNLIVGINWEMIGEYYRYNWVLESRTFFEDEILRGIYGGTQFHTGRPIAGKLLLIRQKESIKYEDLQSYDTNFEDVPFEIQRFFATEKYPFIDKSNTKPVQEIDTRLEYIEGDYICYKLSAVNDDILAFPTRIQKEGAIIKKGEDSSLQYGTASVFKGGLMLAITMHSEERRKKIEPFFSHKLFFIGQYSYHQIKHLTGVGTSVTNDELAARCGREILVTSAVPFEELSFQRYKIQEMPKELAEIAHYLGGKTHNLIIESPSRVNKALIKTDNMGERYFHAACYNALKQNYTKAKQELKAAFLHLFPQNEIERRELREELEKGCLHFFQEDEDILAWFGKK